MLQFENTSIQVDLHNAGYVKASQLFVIKLVN